MTTGTVRDSIRHIFLGPRRHVALMTAAALLGISLRELKKEIADGTIVAVSTGIGQRIPREEMIAVAMRVWPQAEIEETMRALQRLAARFGIHQVLFQLSKGTRFSRFFEGRVPVRPGLNFVYRNLRSQIPPEKLRFTLGDLDNF